MLSRLGKALQRVLSAPPEVVALACALFGLAAVVASFFLDIALVEVTWSGNPLRLTAEAGDSPKQVGFIWALNWSLVSVLLMPLAVYFALDSYQAVPDVLGELARRRMIVTKDWQPVSSEALEARWHRICGGMAIFIVIVVALGVGLTWWDFVTVVKQNYDNPSALLWLSLTDKADEVDWSVAAPLCKALGQGCGVSYWANYWFSMVVYVAIVGLGGIFIMGFFVFVVGITRLVQPGSLKRDGLRLVPALDTDDRRCGFEAFESLFESIIAVTFLTFAIGYLMSLQNIYLRDPSNFILSFVLPDIEKFAKAANAKDFGGALDALIGTLFTDRKTQNVTTAVAVLCGLFIILTITMSLFLSLRRAARVARGELKSNLITAGVSPPAFAAGESKENLLAKLSGMDVWPVAWLNLNRFAIWLLVAMLCLIFYKIGLFLIALGLVVLGKKALGLAKA